MLIALTGGIGSGKSTALNIFKELGAETQDTDLIVHKIYEENTEVHDCLLKRWGSEIFQNGIPDRKKIAQLVFNNEENLKWLNQLFHPRVREIVKAGYTGKLSIIAVPLLYETGWYSDFDSTISVWCSKDRQMKRLMDRGWTKEECLARIAAQMDQDLKRERADFGIINDWSEKFLNRQCRIIFKELQKKES